MRFRGKTISIISDTESQLQFRYDGLVLCVNKKEIEIDAYGNTWNAAQEDTIWLVSDGKIQIKELDSYLPSNAEEDTFGPNDTIIMPTVSEIFSNEDILNAALSYRMDYEEYGWYSHILDGLSLQDFVEGFIVAGGGYWKVISK